MAKLLRAFQQSVLSSQYQLVIDLGDLLRADPELRWTTYQIARNIGVLSTNEIRAQEGWNPLPDASANSHDPLNQSPQAAARRRPRPRRHRRRD